VQPSPACARRKGGFVMTTSRAVLVILGAAVVGCGGGNLGSDFGASAFERRASHGERERHGNQRDKRKHHPHDGGGGEPVSLAAWVGVIGTGQSLSVGAAAGTPISTTQPFGNLKLLDSGPDPKYPLDGGGILSLIPLTEPMKPRLAGYSDSQYPNNIF